MNPRSIRHIALAVALMGMFLLPSFALGELKLTKTANTFDADLGDQVTYTFFLENTGNGTLTNLVLNDNHLGIYELNKSSLAVGENYSMSVNYTLTPKDVFAPLRNVALANARGPGGSVVSNNASFAIATGYSGYLDANGSRVISTRPAGE
ncbi:MAG: hypothetical protein NTX42_09230 [Methanothrix sp.]|nr:hypothetical protein [Methanothrix sp.]